MDISEVRFARSGDIHLAYQRYGSGPDVVLIPPIVSNVEISWEEETYRRARHHIGRHARILEFDKRGIGSSDPVERHPTLEERMSDITAVLDAENVARASLVGLSEGGLMAQIFAARHPERVERLVLVNSLAGPSSYPQLRDYRRDGDPRRTLSEILADFERIAATWGREPEHFARLACPSRAEDATFLAWLGRFQRQTTSPAGFRRQLESIVPLDATAELSRIQAPTLVLHVRGDRVVVPATGRWLADHIPGARYVEFDGHDHYCWCMANWRGILDCWIEFLTGAAPQASIERRFATVLFTDIADSTRLCAKLGDETWRALLQRHDDTAHRCAARHGGKVVKHTGDGMLMTFDMPSSAIACAKELGRSLADDRLTIRSGIHAGEIEVRDDGDVTGLAVNLAARVMGLAENGRIYVSSTVRDLLLGGASRLEDRGEHSLKGIEGNWRLFEVCS